MLRGHEQNEFCLVVQSARAEGWLGPDDAITASDSDSAVLVTRKAGSAVQQRSYERHSCWPYELLRDLAHGVWS